MDKYSTTFPFWIVSGRMIKCFSIKSVSVRLVLLALCNRTTEWVHLCSHVLSLWEDSIRTISALRPVICFAFPVATFHLSDVRQVYGQPSLLRTIGSRVSLSPSLTETIQYHSWDEPFSPPPPMLIGRNICSLCRFWRVIYCWQQQRGSLMINLLWDSACFMGFTSLPLNYAWVFPQRWSWM